MHMLFEQHVENFGQAAKICAFDEFKRAAKGVLARETNCSTALRNKELRSERPGILGSSRDHPCRRRFNAPHQIAEAKGFFTGVL
jgi:hypothetical protein